MSEHSDALSPQDHSRLTEIDVLQRLALIPWSQMDVTEALKTVVSFLGAVGMPSLGLFRLGGTHDLRVWDHTGSQAELPGNDNLLTHLENAIAASNVQPLPIARGKAEWPSSPGEPLVASYLAAARRILVFSACQTECCRAVLVIDAPEEMDAVSHAVLGRFLCNQIQMVAEREKFSRESARLSLDLEQMYARLLKLTIQTSVNRPLNLVAHQFNNFLTPILGYAQLLVQAGTSLEESRLYAKHVFAEAEHMRQVVDNMLLFTRRQNLGCQPTSLNDLLRETAQLHAYEFQKGNVSVEFQLDPKLPLVQADPFKTQVVFSNILRNALQAIKDFKGQGKVVIRTGRCDYDPARLQIEFIDSGAGLHPQLLNKVFDPFYTTHSSQALGLGLTISRALIEEQGGSISARSVLGQGTTFAVELPIAGQ